MPRRKRVLFCEVLVGHPNTLVRTTPGIPPNSVDPQTFRPDLDDHKHVCECATKLSINLIACSIDHIVTSSTDLVEALMRPGFCKFKPAARLHFLMIRTLKETPHMFVFLSHAGWLSGSSIRTSRRHSCFVLLRHIEYRLFDRNRII